MRKHLLPSGAADRNVTDDDEGVVPVQRKNTQLFGFQ
jgi:hypothetical protein